jgi:hypothetical protein
VPASELSRIERGQVNVPADIFDKVMAVLEGGDNDNGRA